MTSRMEPGVIGDALMLDFLDRVPAPHRPRFRLGVGEMARIGQQLMRENGGEMLQRHGRRYRCDRRLGFDEVEAPLHLVFEWLQVIAALDRRIVEGGMFTTVDRFLGRKSFDFLGELGRGAFAESPDALHEKGLALGEGRGESVIKCRRERIAALLLSISSRNARRKLSATHFRLAMSRVDIGNYLGLTVGTVSRVLGRMQKQDILQVDNREIEIRDMQALREIANVAN